MRAGMPNGHALTVTAVAVCRHEDAPDKLVEGRQFDPAETTRNTVNGGLMCTNERFAARLSGRAFGLARVNGPLGW
jgi:hypothetical protein